VRRLIDHQVPSLRDEPIEPIPSSGSTNALFRWGGELVVRLPRQPGGSASILKEAHWLPYVAEHLTAPVPEVVTIGEPGFGYPESWLVTRWIEGATPPVACASSGLARDLAVFAAELGELPVPPEARTDPRLSWYRGRPLADFVDDFANLVDQCREIPGLALDLDHARRVWEDAVAAEASLSPRVCWYHGDLLAENLLAREDRLAAVLDFGGLSVGDPSVDLIAAWEVLDSGAREVMRTALGVSDAAWQKSMGWALLIALLTFPYYWESMPARCADRRAMAVAVLAEA